MAFRIPDDVSRAIFDKLSLSDVVSILCTSRNLNRICRTIVLMHQCPFEMVSKVINSFPRARIKLIIHHKLLNAIHFFGNNIYELNVFHHINEDNPNIRWSQLTQLRDLNCCKNDIIQILRGSEVQPPNLSRLHISGGGMDLRRFTKLNHLQIYRNVMIPLKYNSCMLPTTLTSLYCYNYGVLDLTIWRPFVSTIGTFDMLTTAEFSDINDLIMMVNHASNLTDLGLYHDWRCNYSDGNLFENFGELTVANLRNVTKLCLCGIPSLPSKFLASMVNCKILEMDFIGATHIKKYLVEMPKVTNLSFCRISEWQYIVKFFPGVQIMTLNACNFDLPLVGPPLQLQELNIISCNLTLSKTILNSSRLRITRSYDIRPVFFTFVTAEHLTCSVMLPFSSFDPVLRKMHLRELSVPNASEFLLAPYRVMPFL